LRALDGFLLSFLIASSVLAAVPISAAQNITVQVRTDRATYNPGDTPIIETYIACPTGIRCGCTAYTGGKCTAYSNSGSGAFSAKFEYFYSGFPLNVMGVGEPDPTKGIPANTWYRLPSGPSLTQQGAGTYEVKVTVYEALTAPPWDLEATTSYTVAGAAAGFDFTIALSPPSSTVEQGGTAAYQIQLTYSSPAWSGTVINIQLTGLGPGMTWTSTQTGALTIVTSPSTPTGTYTITVIGSALGVTHQTSALLTVNPRAPPFDFSVSVSPTSQAVSMGDKTTYSVTVNLVSGSASPVSLSLSGLPGGISYSFSPQSGTPTFGSTLTIDASAAQSTGSYALTVTAMGGGLSKTASMTLNVNEAASFVISVSPGVVSVKQGGKAVFNVDVLPRGSFNRPVSLIVRGLPSGASYVFAIPTGTPPFVSALTIDVSTRVSPGTYPVEIDATDGTKTRSVTATLSVETTPKQKSSLTMSASTQNGKITVSGSLTPPVDGAQVTLVYNGPRGAAATHIVTVQSDGSFEDTYSPDEFGDWTVKASWPGNDDYETTTSQPASLTVEESAFDISKILSGIPGFPIESILIGLLGGIVAVTLIRRRRSL